MKEQYEMDKRKELLGKHPYKIWKGKNGKWYTRFPMDDGKKYLRKRNTEEEMEALVCEFWRTKAENPTVQEIFYIWLEKKLAYKEIQKSSADKYETDFERFFVKSEFAKRHIRQIDGDDIEEFLRSQIAEYNLTAKSFSGLRIIVKGIFQFAKKKKWTSLSISEFFGDLDISQNTFRKVIKEKEDEVFSEDEVPVLVDYLKKRPTVWNFGLLLALQTGLRVGELSALKKEDWCGDYLKIRRTETRQKNDQGKNILLIKNFTKTEAGMRDVILSDGGKETLRWLVDNNPDGQYLFENSSGKRIRGNTFNKHLDVVLNHLHMHHRSIHKIRKTYCTMLIEAGCEDAVVMKQLGHTSIETSRKYYYYCNRTIEHQKQQIQSAIAI